MEDADTKDHAPSETVLNSWSKYVEVHWNAEYAWNNTDDSKIPWITGRVFLFLH
jgi:hypothetical protein